MLSNRSIIGQNIRRHRISKNISIDELAEMLQLSPAFIGLIERGQRGAKLDNLLKISKIFDVPINDIIYEYKNSNCVSERKEKPIDVKKGTLKSIIFDLNECELDFVISMIRELKKIRNSEFHINNQKVNLEGLDLSFNENEDDENEDDF